MLRRLLQFPAQQIRRFPVGTFSNSTGNHLLQSSCQSPTQVPISFLSPSMIRLCAAFGQCRSLSSEVHNSPAVDSPSTLPGKSPSLPKGLRKRVPHPSDVATIDRLIESGMLIPRDCKQDASSTTVLEKVIDTLELSSSLNVESEMRGVQYLNEVDKIVTELKRAYQQSDNRSSVNIVSGVSGSGKTRMLYEASRRFCNLKLKATSSVMPLFITFASDYAPVEAVDTVLVKVNPIMPLAYRLLHFYCTPSKWSSFATWAEQLQQQNVSFVDLTAILRYVSDLYGASNFLICVDEILALWNSNIATESQTYIMFRCLYELQGYNQCAVLFSSFVHYFLRGITLTKPSGRNLASFNLGVLDFDAARSLLMEHCDLFTDMAAKYRMTLEEFVHHLILAVGTTPRALWYTIEYLSANDAPENFQELPVELGKTLAQMYHPFPRLPLLAVLRCLTDPSSMKLSTEFLSDLIMDVDTDQKSPIRLTDLTRLGLLADDSASITSSNKDLSVHVTMTFSQLVGYCSHVETWVSSRFDTARTNSIPGLKERLEWMRAVANSIQELLLLHNSPNNIMEEVVRRQMIARVWYLFYKQFLTTTAENPAAYYSIESAPPLTVSLGELFPGAGTISGDLSSIRVVLERPLSPKIYRYTAPPSPNEARQVLGSGVLPVFSPLDKYEPSTDWMLVLSKEPKHSRSPIADKCDHEQNSLVLVGSQVKRYSPTAKVQQMLTGTVIRRDVCRFVARAIARNWVDTADMVFVFIVQGKLPQYLSSANRENPFANWDRVPTVAFIDENRMRKFLGSTLSSLVDLFYSCQYNESTQHLFSNSEPNSITEDAVDELAASFQQLTQRQRKRSQKTPAHQSDAAAETPRPITNA